jgi:sugar transferase (PEP-CTERM/EpsH1 system associated)
MTLTRDSVPPLLYLVHRLPYPPDKGDRIRAFHILRFLSRRAAVHLACLADEPIEGAALDALRSYCARVAVVPLSRGRWFRALGSLLCGRTVSEGAFSSRALRDLIGQWAREVDFQAVLVQASSMVPYLKVPELASVPAVVDLVDVDSEKWFDYAASSRGPRAWLYRTEGRRLRNLERDLPATTRAVTLVGTAEADLYRGFCAAGEVRAITNGVDLDYFSPRAGGKEQSCVFVGALDYRPNVDGANWFCREVWPSILQRYPDARIYLVGRRPAPAVMRLASLPGVELVGQVPDVRPYLARAGVAVVPLKIARGVQNKVLEGLAMGKATIASPEALAGLGVKPGTHVLSAASHVEWVESLGRLWADSDFRQRLGSAGRQYVETHHRWESCLGPFSALLGLTATQDQPRASSQTCQPAHCS